MLPNRVDVFLTFQQALTDVRVSPLHKCLNFYGYSNNNGGSVIQKKRKTRLFKRPLRSTVKLLIPVNFVLLKRNSFSRSFQTLRAGFKVYSSVLRVEHIEVLCLVFFPVLLAFCSPNMSLPTKSLGFIISCNQWVCSVWRPISNTAVNF